MEENNTEHNIEMGNHDLSNNNIEIVNDNNNNSNGGNDGNNIVKNEEITENEKEIVNEQTIIIINNNNDNSLDNNETKEEKKEEEEEELENEDKPKVSPIKNVQRSNSERLNEKNNQMSQEQKEEAEKAKFLSYLPPNYLKEMLKSEEELKEQLIQQTIDSSPIYDTRESLLNANDTSSLLFWGKKISSFTKRRKNFLFQILRIYFTKSDEHFNLLQRQIILSLLPFHFYSIECLENCSKQLEKSFSIDKFDVFDLPITSKKNHFPTIVFELNYEWAISSLRLSKHFYLLGEMEKAHYHCDRTLKLFFRIFLNERKKKTFTQHVFYKLIKAFELITFVKGKESKVIEYVDLFLMQFSNMVMKEKAVQLSIKPLLDMNYSDSRHLTDANSIEVLRYFAKFFSDTKVGKDSAEAVTELDNLPLMLRKENRLKELIDVKGRRMMRDSGLRRREYCFRPDIIWNLLIRRYEPKFAISISSLPKFHMPSVREEKERKYGEVEGLPMSGVDVTFFGTALNLETKKRHFIKVFKAVGKYPVKVAYEMALLLHLSSLSSFIKVHSYFLFDNDLWCIFEGETEGYFIHELVAYPSIFKEGDIALISKIILEGLRDLHSSKLSLRDLTSRNVFITKEGDVTIIPNFFYENYQSRFYTPPENLVPSAKFQPFPADIWSFASILYELCENSPPYATYHPLKEYFYISTNGLPEIKRTFTDEIQVFYSLASDVDPANRASASVLLEHEFIKQSESSSPSDLANVLQSLL